MYELKIYRELFVMIMKKMQTDLCFQKWLEDFSKFSPEHVQKFKNWKFDGVLLFKVENV